MKGISQILTGELWGVHCEELGENPRYNDTALYQQSPLYSLCSPAFVSAHVMFLDLSNIQQLQWTDRFDKKNKLSTTEENRCSIALLAWPNQDYKYDRNIFAARRN